MVESVCQYHLSRNRGPRKMKELRRRQKKSKDASTSKNVASSGISDETMVIEASADNTEVDAPMETKPLILEHLVFGINEVTKLLEDTSKSSRETIELDGSDTEKASKRRFTGLILVCRGDVDPPILISHLPYLVAACNSSQWCSQSTDVSTKKIWLVPLSKGAEFPLSQAMGLRRVSVMAVNVRIFASAHQL